MAEPSIFTALSNVMADVQSVRKGDVNEQQGFRFRGVDAVVNAVAPALRNHSVIVVPDVRDYQYGTVEVGRNRTPMGHARVIVAYTFHGPAGDSITCSAPGEAMDSGDKATAKAMSVAFRTALLQALALPTDEPDPDAHTYQRATPPPANPNTDLINEIYTLAAQLGPDGPKAVLKDWAEGHDNQHIKDATDVGGLELIRDDLAERVQSAAKETP